MKRIDRAATANHRHISSHIKKHNVYKVYKLTSSHTFLSHFLHILWYSYMYTHNILYPERECDMGGGGVMPRTIDERRARCNIWTINVNLKASCVETQLCSFTYKNAWRFNLERWLSFKRFINAMAIHL